MKRLNTGQVQPFIAPSPTDEELDPRSHTESARFPTEPELIALRRQFLVSAGMHWLKQKRKEVARLFGNEGDMLSRHEAALHGMCRILHEQPGIAAIRLGGRTMQEAG